MFTDRYIRNLKPESKIKDIREKNGFGIRIKPDGTKIFFYRYESPVTGARRFLTLGEYPEPLSLEDARIKYGDAYKTVKAGGDPLEAAHQEKTELDAAPTVKVLGADYIKRHAEVNKKSWLEDQRILDKEIYPAWERRKAHDITKGDIIALLDKVVDRGSPQTANNIFKIIRKMFNWAVKKDRLKVSPCTGIDMPAPLTMKDRALTADEIKIVWNTLDARPEVTVIEKSQKPAKAEKDSPVLSMTVEVKCALKLILITAQRPGEVSGLHTSEIDGNWWTIPADRAKNGKAHRVFLTPLAKEIINQATAEVRKARKIPAEKEYSGYIFPCPHLKKDKPIERHALSKALKRNASEDGLTTLGIATFTPHDLRRTAATFMAEQGEMDEVIDAILNHAKQGIIKAYNTYRYDKEKQAALESWSRKLITLTTAKDLSNVISMQAHKAA
jgi:integrase